MLDNFFKINFPYGIEINTDGSVTPFNREYSPLGCPFYDQIHKVGKTGNSTHYQDLSDQVLVKIAHHPINGVQRDEHGQIRRVFFYNDRTNPGNNPKYWPEYQQKIIELNQLKPTPAIQD